MIRAGTAPSALSGGARSGYGYSNFAKFKTDAAELLAARGDRKYSLWYCDIRNFKFINDIYGYDIGDELLSYWAELIAEGARPGETFGRISGDNFALLRCYRDIDDLVARFLRCSDLLTGLKGWRIAGSAWR